MNEAAANSLYRRNKEILRLQIEELWGKGRLELIDDLYTEDVVDHMPLPGQVGGKDALRQVVADFHRAIPDLKITVHGVICEGDRAVDFWTLRGRHTGRAMGMEPTGAQLEFSGIDMVRIRDGKISDIWHVEDLLKMLDQMQGDVTAFGRPQAGRPGDG